MSPRCWQASTQDLCRTRSFVESHSPLSFSPSVPSPDPLRVGRVGHVRPRRLLHGLLVELVFGQGHGAQRTHPQRRRDADLRQRGLRRGLGARRGCSAAGEDVCREGRRHPVREWRDCWTQSESHHTLAGPHGGGTGMTLCPGGTLELYTWTQTSFASTLI